MRYKDRIVSLGFMAIPGVDYTEKFSPVLTDASTRILITLYLHLKKTQPEKKWVLWLVDYEAAFLNAELDEEAKLFIEYPDGMVELGYMTEEEVKTHVAKLNTSMYGNVDTSLRWNITVTKYKEDQMNMQRCLTDPCIIFKKWNNDTELITGMNVDDTIVVATEERALWYTSEVSKRFNITIQKEMKKHLGVDYD